MQNPSNIKIYRKRCCCVQGCNSSSVPFSFHKFPLSGNFITVKNSSGEYQIVDRCLEWKRRIGITNTNDDTVVCSRHFIEDDYFFPKNNSRVKRLNQDAVPSVNLIPEVDLTKDNSPRKKIKYEDCTVIETKQSILKKEIDVEDLNQDDILLETEDVKILKEPSKETLRCAAMDLNEPIVIRNILRKFNGENIWEILNWNIGTFVKTFRDIPVPFRMGYKAQTSRPQWEVDCPVEWLTMKEFLQKTDSIYSYYFDYKYMKEWCQNSPKTLKSLNWSRFGFDLDGKDSTIWIGNEGAHTNCHQDSYGCNLVAQVHGRKEWILFPPEVAKSLRPVRVPYEESTVYSSINFFSPSIKEAKLLKKIPGAKLVVLEPGEVLLVPKGWWHYVESLDLSVSVNVWLPLETDSKARLKEALVKLVVNGIGKNIPSASENSECSVAESINFIKMSVEECRERKTSAGSKDKKKKAWTAKSLEKEYPFFLFPLKNLNTNELQKLFAKKRNRFPTFINNSKKYVVKQENSDTSNQLLIETIVNAFCDLDLIDKVADSLLNNTASVR